MTTSHQSSLALLGFALGAGAGGLLSYFLRRREAEPAATTAKPAEAKAKPQGDALSVRGSRAQQPILSYLGGHFDATLNRPYDAETRPDGLISVCIAENKLGWDFLAPHVQTVDNVDGNMANYNNMAGCDFFRDGVADLMTRYMLQAEHLDAPPVDRPYPAPVVAPEDLVCNAGVSALLHHLAMCLFDAGDSVLTLGPYYPAFDYDMVVQAALDMVPVVPASPAPEITRELLEAALGKAEAAGKAVRGLLMTNPTNPTGQLLTRAEVEAALAFAEAHELQLISDEVYALSIHAPGEAHLSVAHLRPSLGPRTHVLWGMSKDLCVSGARVGVLWTQNESLKSAMGNISALTCVSTFTQYALRPFLGDTEKVRAFILSNTKALRNAYGVVTTIFKAGGVTFLPAQGGMFIWLDLRELLAGPAVDTQEGWEAEEELTQDFIDAAGLVLTPGQPCHAPTPGYFRLCFAWNSLDVTEVAAKRLVAYAKLRRQVR